MIEKVLEAFFRHVWLIVLPIAVIPLDVTAAVFATPPQYEAQAAMWVERATYLSYTDDINRYLSAAQNQRNRLAELMRTRTFLNTVASQTGLAPVAASPTGAQDLDELFARDFDATVTGDHLILIRFRAEDRALAGQVLSEVFRSFKARATADQYSQAQVAISFYQGRQVDSEAQLAAARQELSKYLAINTAVANTLARNGLDAARLDAQFAELQRRVDAVQRDADQARALLASAHLDVTAGAQGEELGVRLVDPVGVSTSPSRQLKKALVFPIVAVAVGFLLSAALLLMFSLLDRSIRSVADLAPDTVILGVVPRLRPRGVVRRHGSGVTRRAIAFGAGAPVQMREPAERTAS